MFSPELNFQLVMVMATNRCRDASREELLRIFQASESIYYDEIPVNRAKFYDLDLDSFRSFMREHLDVEVNDDSDIEYYLKNFHLVTGANIPTVTGILFFGKNPQNFISQARIICASINSNDIATAPSDRKEIISTIPKMISDSENFLRLNLKTRHDIKDFEPESREEIPLTALREAIINAIAHRDYTINAPIRIIIFSDRVEIHSPGKLPNTVSTDSMRIGGSHVLRNPTIYNLLVKIRMVTDLGSGVRRIIKLVKDNNDKDVLLIPSESEFVLTIPRPNG